MDEDYRKVLIIDSKSTGFSRLNDSMTIVIKATTPTIYDTTKQSRLILTIRPPDQKRYYKIDSTVTDNGEIVGVVLRRETKEAFGEITVSVIFKESLKTEAEEKENTKELEELLRSAEKAFLGRKTTIEPIKSTKEMANEVQDLLKKLFGN